MAEAARIHPLADRAFARGGIQLAPLPFSERISLRAGTDGVAALSAALGIDLPGLPRTSAGNALASALWLGPDEWMLIGEQNGAMTARLDRLTGFVFSAVDISHRNTAIALEGPLAQSVLNSGCPQDLSLAAFPVGACARTLLAKAEIVLWRQGEQKFRVECWRSFADYVWSYLVDAAISA